MNSILFHARQPVALRGLIVACGARCSRREGVVTLRWRATPRFVAFLLLSFSVSVITLNGVMLVAIAADVQLAPGATNLWRDWAWRYGFAWLRGLWLVLKGPGAQFASPNARRLVMRCLAAVVLPLTLFDGASVLLLQKTATPHLLGEGVSPDGKLRIVAMRWDWLPSSSCEILLMQKNPLAFTATRLCRRGVSAVAPDGCAPTPSSNGQRIPAPSPQAGAKHRRLRTIFPLAGLFSRKPTSAHFPIGASALRGIAPNANRWWKT
jgi:hypothetical protein